MAKRSEISKASKLIEELHNAVAGIETNGGRAAEVAGNNGWYSHARSEALAMLREVYPQIELVVAARLKAKIDKIKAEFPGVEFD